jgi:hypothetical protein
MAAITLPLRYGTPVRALRSVDGQIVAAAAYVITTEDRGDGVPTVIVEFIADAARIRYVGDGIAECLQLP